MHALRHGVDVSAVMLRVLDDAEQAAARIDWSGGGVVAAPDGTTDRPRVTDIDAPQLSPAPAGATLGLPTFIDDPLHTRATVLHDLAARVPLTGYNEELGPHTAANDGSGRHTRVNADGGVLTLDHTGGGGGGGGSLFLILALLFYYKLADQTALTMLAQQHAAHQILLDEAGAASAAVVAAYLWLARKQDLQEYRHALREGGLNTSDSRCVGHLNSFSRARRAVKGGMAHAEMGTMISMILLVLCMIFSVRAQAAAPANLRGLQ